MKFDKLYNDPKSPAAYAGEQALFKLAQKYSKNVKLKDVRNWLKKKPSKLALCINLFEENSCVARLWLQELIINGKPIWQTCQNCQIQMINSNFFFASLMCFQSITDH